MTGDNEGSGEPGPGMPQATGGGRVAWEAMPDEATVLIERLLGGEVVSATSQPGGFSDGLAARVRLADGGRCFVKQRTF
jgi:hypothetical protein